MFDHFWVSNYARHLRFLRLEAEKALVFEQCVEAIAKLNAGFEFEQKDLSVGEIVAEAKATWNKPASLVTVHVVGLSGGWTEVEILSRPAALRAAQDFGQNKKNLDSISRFLLKQIGPLANYSIITVTNPWNVTLDLPHDDAFDACLGAIEQLGQRTKSKREDRNGGIIVAKTRASFKSWGETIRFDVSASDEGTVSLKIESKPAWFLTLSDWGSNQKNIEEVCRALRRLVIDQH